MCVRVPPALSIYHSIENKVKAMKNIGHYEEERKGGSWVVLMALSLVSYLADGTYMKKQEDGLEDNSSLEHDRLQR